VPSGGCFSQIWSGGGDFGRLLRAGVAEGHRGGCQRGWPSAAEIRSGRPWVVELFPPWPARADLAASGAQCHSTAGAAPECAVVEPRVPAADASSLVPPVGPAPAPPVAPSSVNVSLGQTVAPSPAPPASGPGTPQAQLRPAGPTFRTRFRGQVYKWLWIPRGTLDTTLSSPASFSDLTLWLSRTLSSLSCPRILRPSSMDRSRGDLRAGSKRSFDDFDS
jgi:hypothetical protein